MLIKDIATYILVHHKELNDQCCIIIPILQVGNSQSRKGKWLALGTAVGEQSQDSLPGLSDSRDRGLPHCPTWPLRVDDSNLPGGHRGKKLGAQTGISSPAFLAGIWRVSSHCWPRVDLVLSVTLHNQDNIYSAHSSEAARKGQPTPGPINLGGMDFLLELFQGAHSLLQQG